MDPNQWYLAQIPCPLFKDGKCISSIKPIMCSTHGVSSPPESCSPISEFIYNRINNDSIVKEAYDQILSNVDNHDLVKLSKLHIILPIIIKSYSSLS